MKTKSCLSVVFVLEKSQRGSQRVMSNEIHFYSEPQETEGVSKNDLLTQSLLSREG